MGIEKVLAPVITEKISEEISKELTDYFMKIITPIIAKHSEDIAMVIKKSFGL